jgi:multiple sugar transport system ATP-binding protein
VIESLGDELLVHLRVGDDTLVAKLPAETRIERGERREFSVPLRHIRLFDAKTERALGAPDALVDRAAGLAA